MPPLTLRRIRNIPGRHVFRDLCAGRRGGRDVVRHAPFRQRCNLPLLALVSAVGEESEDNGGDRHQRSGGSFADAHGTRRPRIQIKAARCIHFAVGG